MIIRKANTGDAAEASVLLQRSIIELCAPDHASEIEAMSEWTANKTPEQFRQWVSIKQAMIYVAERTSQIVGVCMMNKDGEIYLNYILPEVRFTGVSKAMLLHMEAQAKSLGLGYCTLSSTKTAEAFYLAAGYVPTGEFCGEDKRLQKNIELTA